MAARAGAVIADAEFVQFHPTAIDIGRDPAPLATEALRGEGATLVNDAASVSCRRCTRSPSWRRATSSRAACSPRSPPAVARSSTHGTRWARRFAEKFPTVYASCMAAGIDPRDAADPGRAGRALSHGRHRGRRAWPHLAAGPVGRRRSRRRPARTAPTGWRRTRCWRRPSMPRASPRISRATASARARSPAGDHRWTSTTAPCRRCAEKDLRAMMTSHVGVMRDGGHLAAAVRVVR